jgi:hypothetical protein
MNNFTIGMRVGQAEAERKLRELLASVARTDEITEEEIVDLPNIIEAWLAVFTEENGDE